MGLRILLLTTDAYGGHGGIAYYNRCLAEAFAEMPEVKEVVVLARVMRFAPEGTPRKVQFISESSGSKTAYLRSLLGLAGQNFDLVICGHVNLLPLAAPFAMFKRTPLVLQVHGIDVWQPAKAASRAWLPRVNAVWSVSAVTLDRMNAWANLPLSKYTIIPNTIHLERYGLAPKRADLVKRYALEGRKIILSLARLSGFERYKGIDEILEAMPALLQQEPRLTYMVLGDGDDQARLEAKAQTLGVADKVIFAGFVREFDKADYLRLADVFALPGRGEGFGIVYLEAMACGIPVVGSALDGSSEALRGGMLGELVDPTNLESIKRGILSALENPRHIPDGLSHFLWPAFVARIATAVQKISK
ncbi:MAG: glycosyltransferase [Thiobacillus sp.]|nr:glycosyltransferase [Thiobacillus sp.]